MTAETPPEEFICWTSELRRMDVERLTADVERTAYWLNLGINPESRLAADFRRQTRAAKGFANVHELLLALEANDWRIR